jgi:hypothetical protein
VKSLLIVMGLMGGLLGGVAQAADSSAETTAPSKELVKFRSWASPGPDAKTLELTLGAVKDDAVKDNIVTFSDTFNETNIPVENLATFDPNWVGTGTDVLPPLIFWYLDGYGNPAPFLEVGATNLYPRIYNPAYATYTTGLTGDVQSSTVIMYFYVCGGYLDGLCLSSFGPTVENKYIYSTQWSEYGWQYYTLNVTQTGWSVHRKFVPSSYGCATGGSDCTDTVLYTYPGSFTSKDGDGYTLSSTYNAATQTYTFSVMITQEGVPTHYPDVGTDTNSNHGGTPGMGGVIGGLWSDDGGIFTYQAESVYAWVASQSVN